MIFYAETDSSNLVEYAETIIQTNYYGTKTQKKSTEATKATRRHELRPHILHAFIKGKQATEKTQPVHKPHFLST